MKKSLFILSAISIPVMGMAQSAVDVANLSHEELRGTARYMSMGGAFTALGGDISAINHNPGGIGIYRSSELGITFDLNFQKSTASDRSVKTDETQTKFNVNNFGYVGSIRLNNDVMPFFSWGANYARVNSFDRMYTGSIASLQSVGNGGASLSNYIAAITNSDGVPEGDMQFGDSFNPYLDGNAPWLSILGYQGYVINPTSSNSYQGLMGDNTTGSAYFHMREKGYTDEYNITFGGNLSNVVYWGLGIGITDMNYTQVSYYEENLDNAHIAAQSRDGSGDYYIVPGQADYRLTNYLNSNGSGFNLKFGLIFKPINEFRLGFAVHTPTWYQMTDTYWASIDYAYRPNDSDAFYDNIAQPNNTDLQTNEGRDGWNDYHMRTPWRLMVGAAGVIGSQGIISVDYEYRGNNTMQISDVDGYEYEDVTHDVKTYYKGTNILRVGAEYRVTPQFSLRAGYVYESSPVKQEVADDQVVVWTAGTVPYYNLDRTTRYITAGLGYRFGAFYADLAYVNKHRESTYHAFSPIIENGAVLQGSPSASIVSNDNHVVLTLGYRF